MFAGSLVCPLWRSQGKLATGFCVSDRDEGVESGRVPTREDSVFDRSQGKELGGWHPEGRYGELGKDQGTKLGDTC